MLNITRKGYYEVWVDNVKVSQHSDPYKAAVRGLEEKRKGLNVVVKQPDLEPEADSLVVFLTQSEYDNLISKEDKIYGII